MDLSIIIVNYNVKHFLEHCLLSVENAIHGIEAEVFIIDNNSTDNSKDYFENRFSQFEFIYNQENEGFAKGNNIAVKKATGSLILFLNPDTIVPEDCFQKCIAFMTTHLNAGALGVRMIDGAGNFLKESKRSFPSPLTSFYKLSGLSRLFPTSKKFSQYHLGNLDEYQNHEVDVLAGAFMMVRKSIIDKIGSFDESFFMYGEDVDLSYRIQKAGYQNYYFAETTIIHFKGESTKRGSLNYVRMFYKAMSQFVTKHYGQTKAGTFNAFIQAAITIRAFLSGLKRFISWIGIAIIDAFVIILSIWGTKLFWYAYVKPYIKYNREVIVSGAIIYMLVYLTVSYLTGLYDKPFKQKNLNRSALFAALILLACYGLLPETLRFSRGIILLSAAVIFITLSWVRLVLSKFNLLDTENEQQEEKQTIAICTADEFKKITHFYEKAGMKDHLLGFVDVANQEGLANVTEFDQFQKNIQFKNIVYSTKSISTTNILTYIQQYNKYKPKFFNPLLNSIISSDHKDAIGESITLHGHFSITTSSSKRSKRLFDIAVSILLLLLCPIFYFFMPFKVNYFTNLISCLLGNKTIVGYNTLKNDLPGLPTCLLQNSFHLTHKKTPEKLLYELDYRYAKSYRWVEDLKILVRSLGKKFNY